MSPFGEKNQAAPEARMTITRPMMMLQLLKGDLASLWRSKGQMKPYPFAMMLKPLQRSTANPDEALWDSRVMARSLDVVA